MMTWKPVALLFLGTAAGVAAAQSPPGLEPARARLDALHSYELVTQVTLELSRPTDATLRRVYSYRVLVDGNRYRIDSSSFGDETPILSTYAVGFDGASTWLRFGDSSTTTLRAGELDTFLRAPVPDPLLLQYEALASIGGRDERHLMIPDLRKLRSELLAASEQAQEKMPSIQGGLVEGATIELTEPAAGGVRIATTLTTTNGMAIPTAVEHGDRDERGAWSSWRATGFSKTAALYGVAGLPEVVELVSFDPEEAPPKLSTQIRLVSFRTLEQVDVREFSFDPDVAGPIWDEDARIFLRP